MGTVHEELCTFIIVPHSALPRLRNVSDKVAQKFKISILYSTTFIFSKLVLFIRECGKKA